MMARPLFGSCAVLLLAMTAPALAIEPPPTEEIVVEGARLTPQERQAKATSYVRTVSSNAYEGQIARWLVPICVQVDGLDPKLAEIVAEKVRQTAREVRARVARRRCKPNVVVEFTDDALRRFNELDVSRGRNAFGDMSPVERDNLREAASPVKWLYGTTAEGADGMPFQSMPSIAISNLQDLPLPKNGQYGNSYSSSMIRAKSRVGITYALILVDANRSKGKTLESVAAYVSFVALARTRLGISPNDPPTVLGLFGGQGEVMPTDLTEWDMSYLSALYRMPMDRMAAEQRKYLAGTMAKGSN